MEFKINKIDMEVRDRINAKTSEGKVHSKDLIKINRDSKHKDESNNEEFKDVLSKRKNENKKIVVQAVKNEDLEIEASKEVTETEERLGKFLDVRK